jgi:hypothetical protein
VSATWCAIGDDVGVRALLGSLALHALVAAAFVIAARRAADLATPARTSVPPSTVEIDLIDPEATRPATVPSTSSRTAAGDSRPPAGGGGARGARARTTSPLDELAVHSMEPGDRGEGGGRGGGRGRGRGDGTGRHEIGVAIASLPEPPPPPPPPERVATRARPARLIYPVRERPVDASELYVARVTVDHDGFVVGARIVRGLGGPRDGDAAGLIFKFRYQPALDADGHAIASTFDQPFAIGR